jgi:hypothetical protein
MSYCTTIIVLTFAFLYLSYFKILTTSWHDTLDPIRQLQNMLLKRANKVWIFFVGKMHTNL